MEDHSLVGKVFMDRFQFPLDQPHKGIEPHQGSQAFHQHQVEGMGLPDVNRFMNQDGTDGFLVHLRLGNEDHIEKGEGSIFPRKKRNPDATGTADLTLAKE